MKSLDSLKKTWLALTHRPGIRSLSQHEDKVLLILTLMIGATVGLLIVAFIVLTENLGSRMYPAGGVPWRRLFIPVMGALVTGYLLFRHFPGARGSGIPQTKTALFLQGGVIPLRTVLGKFCCSSVSLASGIALGREGPSVQVGAGIASVLGRHLGLSPSNAKALVPIGASAALAAAFNTPIAAVLFTLEEVLGDLHARVLGAIVMSSATSWLVLRLLLGDEPLFHVPAYQLVHPVEFIFYAALGAIGGFVSAAFVKILLKLRKYFLNLPGWTTWFQPVAGGLLVGILGWGVPEVLGVGYSHVSDALNSRLTIGAMALLVALKLIATATCYASGNAGGIFGPSLFIGAMMGGAFGAGAHAFLPDYTGSVGAYALVGMGAAFAGIIRVPMTSVIMIFEVTRDYSIIVPLMIANLISYFISSRLQKVPIYEALMLQDGIHLPALPREREQLTVVSQKIRKPDQVLQGSERIADTLTALRPGVKAWPVVDNDHLLGMVTLSQLQQALEQGRQQANIADLLSLPDPDTVLTAANYPHLYPDQPLETAICQMAEGGVTVLPVVSRANPRELVGIFRLSDALANYRLEDNEETVDGTHKEKKAPSAVLGGILAVIVLMIALAGFLSYFYRSQRALRAEQFALAGDELMARDRYQEAVERYRSALSISHSTKDRLALAMALLNASRWNEAEIYLKELIRENPDSGPANLGLARIAAERNNAPEATNYYHKAIYGNWPDKYKTDGIQIRMELVKFLWKVDRLTQARAEMLSLMAETPEDMAARKQVAHLLLDYGLSAESSQMFREILRKNPQDAGSYAGLGQAEFARGDLRSARQAFNNALRRNPEDAISQKRLELADQILGLDPNQRGLSASEKYARSRKLIEAILESLDRCLGAEINPPTQSPNPTVDAARKSLLNRRRPRSHSDAAEANMALCEQLWRLRIDSCGPPKVADEALRIVMTRLSQ